MLPASEPRRRDVSRAFPNGAPLNERREGPRPAGARAFPGGRRRPLRPGSRPLRPWWKSPV